MTVSRAVERLTAYTVHVDAESNSISGSGAVFHVGLVDHLSTEAYGRALEQKYLIAIHIAVSTFSGLI